MPLTDGHHPPLCFPHSSAPIYAKQTDRRTANGQVNMDVLSLTASGRLILTSWSPRFLFFPQLSPNFPAVFHWMVGSNLSVCACFFFFYFIVSVLVRGCIKYLPSCLQMYQNKNSQFWKRHKQKMVVMKRGSGILLSAVWSEYYFAMCILAHLTMKLSMPSKNHWRESYWTSYAQNDRLEDMQIKLLLVLGRW